MKSSIQRNIGPFALMLTGLGSIIGSGWLFGAWKAAKIAGPAAICAWIIGAVVILAIALTYAELGAMFPESGGMVRYARYSHGSLVGFISAWANWIAIVSVIPIEAEASIQYMSTWPYPWAHALFVNGELQTLGLLLSAVLVVIYFMLNYWGVKAFARANTAITIFVPDPRPHDPRPDADELPCGEPRHGIERKLRAVRLVGGADRGRDERYRVRVQRR